METRLKKLSLKRLIDFHVIIVKNGYSPHRLCEMMCMIVYEEINLVQENTSTQILHQKEHYRGKEIVSGGGGGGA